VESAHGCADALTTISAEQESKVWHSGNIPSYDPRKEAIKVHPR